MSDINLLLKYFPNLTEKQINQFSVMGEQYVYWNDKINVISRKDIEQIYLRHILHSLAIASFAVFPKGSRVLDLGTGGGFPGIPLAIMYPDVFFTLVDSIGKKIKVVNEISNKLECKNIRAINSRAESLNTKFDYIVSRAVTNMPTFLKWIKPLIKHGKQISPQRGIIALKGGDLKEELGDLYPKTQIIPISNYFNEDFFSSKLIVYLPF